MEQRVVLQWTDTAKKQLAELPPKVRRGLLDKVSRLRESDPRSVGKALTGPLQGHYRITYARYRAIYTLEEETLADGQVLTYLRVLVIAVGMRKQHDKKDVYDVAKRLIQLGLVDEDIDEDDIEIQDSG